MENIPEDCDKLQIFKYVYELRDFMMSCSAKGQVPQSCIVKEVAKMLCPRTHMQILCDNIQSEEANRLHLLMSASQEQAKEFTHVLGTKVLPQL